MPVNGKSRRSYRGAPVSNTLGVTLSEAATNITLSVAMSGWSTDGEPFFVVVDPGTAKEEKICVKYNSSTTLTVVDPASTSTWSASAAGRGADGTVDRDHEQGAVIYPVFTALEANQANELVSKYANAGSVVYQGTGTPGTFTELAIGTTSHVLRVNSGVPQWGQVATAGIENDAVTAAKIATAVAGSGLAGGAGVALSVNVDDSTIEINSDTLRLKDTGVTLAKLAAAVANALVPVGTIAAYAGVTAPTGWLLCNGTSTTGYTSLAALVGATTPDMRGRFPIGDNATLTLLATGGSLKVTEANLPSHSHTINHDHAAFTSGDDSPDHSHGYDAPILGTNPLLNVSDTSVTYAFTTTSGATTGASIRHQHSINVPDFAGTSGSGSGSGTDYYPPHLVVNYIIKHD